MIELSEVEAGWVMNAFDQLQATDMLSSQQLELALKIMDRFPDLSREFGYLRDRYHEKHYGN